MGGCTSSKLDDLPAVALCRHRCSFLDEAIHRRYALAEAHAAYLHSLKGLGLCLQRFFDRDLDSSTAAPHSPVLNLPPKKKGDPDHDQSCSPAAVLTATARLSSSNSGSHLKFNSDSEDEEPETETESESVHHHLNDTTFMHPYGGFSYPDHETLASFPNGSVTNMNCMKKQTTAHVVYQQFPARPENVQRVEFSIYNSSYSNSDQNPSSYYEPYSNYDAFYGKYSQSQPPELSYSEEKVSYMTHQPPPPPPPSSSGWEFLNPFESVEQYYPQYTLNSKEVIEEGIPDLEDENHQQEIVKEVLEDSRSIDGNRSSSGSSHHSKRVTDDVDRKACDTHSHSPSVSMENPAEVPMVDKNVVEEKVEKSEDGVGVVALKSFRNDSEVINEIQIQFERASEFGNELAKILEVGKLPYNRKHAAYHGATKMLNVFGPLVASSVEISDQAYSDIDGDVGVRSKNLSSTLKQLYFWEEKLYEEVKVEEKMRVLHERKCKKLKHLDEKGAEPQKVDTTRRVVRSLSTKIRIAVQVVDKVSVKISKLRDEELWPQLIEFIQGLSKMWKCMLECHQSQCQAISQSKRLDAISSRKNLSDADIEAILHLEKELVNLTLRFSCWVSSQKDYVRALNNWLLKCLLYEPEETTDGIAPFSLGWIGVPPVFVVCNQWAQALERISEKEVLDSVSDFATSVFHLLWERDKLEMDQRINDMQREDKKIQKEILVLEKMMAGNNHLETGGVVYQSESSTNRSLQLNMQCIFEAMERFTASSLRSYEELLQSIEQDCHAQDN